MVERVKKKYREEIILNALAKKDKLTTHEAVVLLGTSECTTRRIFNELEEKGAVERCYGGIKAARKRSMDYQFEFLQLHHSEQKTRIGIHAAMMVASGDLFYLDTGTTAQQMALALSRRIHEGKLKDIQVFTNSLQNLMILKRFCDVNLIGGQYRDRREDFCGYLSEMVLQNISFEKCYLSADGISLNQNDGVMAMDIFTARMNQTITMRGRSMILLADSAKFTRRSFIKYADISAFSKIITDSGLSEEIYDSLRKIVPDVVLV